MRLSSTARSLNTQAAQETAAARLGLSQPGLALARSRAYALAARLFREGVTRDSLPGLRRLPGLAEHLPHPFDPDEAAAEHHRLFRLAVPPHESLFRDPSGLLGGPVVDALLAHYARLGFTPSLAAVGPDAIGEELALLAFLCGAEADAWKEGQEAVVLRMGRLQQEFLATHLLGWLFPFALAVDFEKSPFYAGLVELLLALVADHARGVDVPVPAALALPEPPALLDDERVGLREIAAHLTNPVYSGVFLSRGAVARLARRLDLPRGFGPRAQMLENLLHAAVQYERLPSTLAALAEVLDRWQRAYDAQMREFPHLQSFIHPWRAQVDPARRILYALASNAPRAP